MEELKDVQFNTSTVLLLKINYLCMCHHNTEGGIEMGFRRRRVREKSTEEYPTPYEYPAYYPRRRDESLEITEYEEDLLREEELIAQEEIYIKSMPLSSAGDVHRVVEELKKGNIVIINVQPLANKDAVELKKAIEQLKGICEGIGGDIAGICEERVIVTPPYVKIWKG